METELFKKYAEIKRNLKDLKDQEDLLKEAILKNLEKDQVKKKETIWGKFTVAVKKNYEYTDKITELDNKLKIAKIEEQEKGLAKISETKYLTYKL